MPVLGNRPDQPLADADLVLARRGPRALEQRRRWPHLPRLLAHAAHHDVGELGGVAHAAERDDDVRPRGSPAARPSAPRATWGDAGEDADRLAVEPARHLGVGALPEHEHVPVGAGAGERRGEAVGEREHADEHRDHEPDAERGERGGHRALAHAPQVVGERDLHSTFLSAATTGSRAARTAGTMPLASISSSAIAGADRQRRRR